VHSEFLQVNYAKVVDLAKLIKTTTGKDSMLSPRGSLSVDERTNTLLVQDTADRLQDIRRLVQTLDVPVKQVLIEARIVVVSDTFERDLGARLGVTGFTTAGGGSLISVSGTNVGTDSMTQSGITNLTSTGKVTPVTLPTLDNRYQVNLPAANTNGSIGISVLGGKHLRRKTKARARPFRRPASSPPIRSRPQSCKVPKFPIRNLPRAAPPPRSSRTRCCRSR
jgi:type IV pilus assembly protein PilQ